MTAQSAHSLYERVGGAGSIGHLVAAFYRRVLADPELSPFFADTSVETLQRMQAEFFAAAFDGPIQYSGRTLAEVHSGRGIRARHLRRFLEHLMDTLSDEASGVDLDENDRFEIYSRISTYADEITDTTTVDG
jgi:hemoglobin